MLCVWVGWFLLFGFKLNILLTWVIMGVPVLAFLSGIASEAEQEARMKFMVLTGVGAFLSFILAQLLRPIFV